MTNALHYLSKRGDSVTIGADDLTRMITRLILHLNNVSILIKVFLYVEQTRTELAFLETLITENHFHGFDNNLRQWLMDLLMTMDLFNEELYTKVSSSFI